MSTGRQELLDQIGTAQHGSGLRRYVTQEQAAFVVDLLEVDKLHEYIGLLERGWGSDEARAEVWTVGEVQP